MYQKYRYLLILYNEHTFITVPNILSSEYPVGCCTIKTLLIKYQGTWCGHQVMNQKYCIYRTQFHGFCKWKWSKTAHFLAAFHAKKHTCMHTQFIYDRYMFSLTGSCWSWSWCCKDRNHRWKCCTWVKQQIHQLCLIPLQRDKKIAVTVGGRFLERL